MLSKCKLWSYLATFGVLASLCQIPPCVTEEYIRNCSVVPTITYKGDNVELYFSGNTSNYKELTVKGIVNLKFTCLCKLPIDFHFKGQLPNFFTSSQTKRYTGTVNWDKSENFCYETIVNVTTKIDATGEYTCSVVPSVGKGTTSLYLYSDGDARESILNAGRTSRVEITPEDTTVVIPCRVKHPNVTTSLEKDGVVLNFTQYENYDPQKGYELKIDHVSDIVGHYKCKANNTQSWDYINATVSFVNETKEGNKAINAEIPRIEIIDGAAEDKNQKMMICNGTGGVREFKYIKCLTPTDCGIAENCLQNKESSSKCYQELGTECAPIYWPDAAVVSVDDCQMISKRGLASSGVLKCETNEKTEQTARFFTDLKGKLVFDTPDPDVPPLADILQIAQIPYDWENANVWTEEKINVTCRASKFKFSIGFIWIFILQNGSIINADAKDMPDVEVHENYYSGTAEVKVTSTKIKKIGCYAPKLNSLGWENVSISLNVTNSTTPVFDNPKNKTVELDLRDEKQELKCQASGNPLPTITWYKFDEELRGTNFTYTLGESIVNNEKVSTVTSVFNPRINRVGDNETIFVCNATNIRGTVLKTFTVHLMNKEIVPPTPPFPPYVIGVIVSCVLLVVLMTALLLRLCWRDNYVRLHRTDEQNFIYGEKPTVEMDNAGTQTDLPQPSPYAMSAYNKDKYEVLESKLEKKEVIGEGQFGVVYRYVWKDVEGEREVACKTIKDPNDIEGFKLLLEEIKILQHVGDHPNVIRLLGAVTKDIKRLHAFMVVEYCHFGNLKKYLLDHRGSFHSEISERGNFLNISSTQPIGDYVQLEYAMKTSDLIQWSYEIANGMDYLGEKRLVHRDLAARNIVLDSKRVAKITDFGLCKIIAKNTDSNAGGKHDIYIYTVDPGKKNPVLPLPWLAPEIVEEGICSTYSDIWAYGITLWEIFSLGEQPYPGKFTTEITKFLEDGNRMEKPAYCNTAIYNTMLNCWKQTPKERPRFSELRNTFENLQARLRECESSSMCPSEGEENSDEEGNVDSDTMET